jgi:hypothetical protein
MASEENLQDDIYINKTCIVTVIHLSIIITCDLTHRM